MSVLKKIGGILALIAGVLMSFYLIWGLILYGFPADVTGIINTIINLALIILILLGAVLGIADKRAGGILLIIIAIVMILFSILYTLNPLTFGMLAPYTIISLLTTLAIPYVTLEAILILVDAILILAGGAD